MNEQTLKLRLSYKESAVFLLLLFLKEDRNFARGEVGLSWSVGDHRVV